VILLVVIAVVAFSGGGGDGEEEATDDTEDTTEETEDTTEETEDTEVTTDDTGGSEGTTEIPFAIGDDPELDDLTVACSEGDLGACDDLYVQSPIDTNYEDYGNTCGGRLPEGAGGSCESELGDDGTPDTVEATEVPFALGDDAALDTLTTSCADGDLGACDDLYFDAPIDSNYESFGQSCGGRLPEGTGGTCELDLG
jgi:hypothetical protein